MKDCTRSSLTKPAGLSSRLREGGTLRAQRFRFYMIAQILEWPHPIIDQDWDSSQHRWREITPLAYKELQSSGPLREEQSAAFMQAEPVDVLADGKGFYVCCKREHDCYFARLLPGADGWNRNYVPVPEVSALF